MKRDKGDAVLFVVAIILLLAGIFEVFSASAIRAKQEYQNLFYFQMRQIAWGLFCIMLLLWASRYDFEKLTQRGRPVIFLGLSFVLLAGLFVFGSRIHGALRWYNLGIFNFQPSELVKLLLIIYYADLFARRGDSLRDWKTLMLHMSYLGMIVGLILIQPNLSTSLMIILIIAVMMTMSHVRVKHILAAAAFISPVLVILIVSRSYQSGRFWDWITNLGNLLGSGHQVKQSLIAFGRGGFFGVGPGLSKQKFLFLPDSHTDFIFSILGEELGFLGTTFFLLLFVIILWRGIRIARNAPTAFGQYLAVGLTMNLVLYAFVNAAVTTMVLPVTGLPMPFISYGGTSLLVSGLTVGLLLSISRQGNARPLRDHIKAVQGQQEYLTRKMMVVE